MCHIGLSIKKISTDASSNSWWSFKEGIYTTLTLPGRFDAFAGRDEDLDEPGCDIVMVLGKSEAELKIDFFLTNTGVCVYAVNFTAKSEEGESAGSLIVFFWLEFDSLSRRIEKQ